MLSKASDPELGRKQKLATSSSEAARLSRRARPGNLWAKARFVSDHLHGGWNGYFPKERYLELPAPYTSSEPWRLLTNEVFTQISH